MDTFKFIQQGGFSLEDNPNYDPTKKRSKEPKQIVVSNFGNSDDRFSQLGLKTAREGWWAPTEVVERYAKHKINYNPYENLDKQLADSQSAMTKWGNALAQTLVSEIGLGTLKGVSDLFDFIGQSISISDHDYSNPVSRFLEEKQEEFRNYAAIHADPNLNISNGGLLDAGWWASNIPSVASSLTLLIPASGVVKGVSALGKGLHVASHTRNAVRAITGASRRINQGRKLNTFQKVLNSDGTAKAVGLFLENGTTAALMRTMENYQESRQTYNNMYADASETLKNLNDEEYADVIKQNEQLLQENGVDPNNRDEVAKIIAQNAADVTFKLDWMNVGWDVLQMYGLRNAWKGLRNAPGSSASIRRAQKDAIKYFGKTEAEIAALKAQRKFSEKAGEWISDRLYGSKLLIASQLSEGAEEALNFIAQEEGIHFGKVLLGKEKGNREYSVWNNVFNGFDGRITQYAQAPTLWDSAFWGVMGGIVFQAAGSKFRQIQNKITDKKSDANEESKQSLPWYKFDELPEVKRRISEIQSRAIDFNRYKELLQRINDGEDIYRSTKDNIVNFENEIEQNAAREKLKNEYISNMTLKAMHTGNLDMLKAYLADDNIRRSMVEAGIFNNGNENKSNAEIEYESRQYIESAIKKIEEVEEMYDNELIAVNEASAYINRKSDWKGYVPAEYMQIVANNNVKQQLAIQAMNTELIGINERISQLESQFADSLDPNIDYRNNIKIGVLTNELGRLRAERKRIMNDNDNSLSNQIAIKTIDKRIESIENDLNDEQLAYATFMSLRYTKKDNGEIIQEDTPEAFAYRDKMIIRHAENNAGDVILLTGLETFGLSERSRTAMDDSGVGAYKTLENDARTTFNELRNISPELDTLYQRKAAIEKSIDFTKKDISRTVDEVSEHIGMLHNTMNETRKKAISVANESIQDLYNKYGEKIKDYIYKRYNNTQNTFDKGDMTDNELTTLKDAVDVLAITKSYNQSLIIHLEQLFAIQDAIKAGQSVENPTNKNENLDVENSEIESSSTNTNETNTNEINEQNNGVPVIDNPQQTDNREPSFYVEFYNNKGKLESGKHKKEDNGKVAVYDNGDGTFTLDVRDDKSKINDTRFFSNANSVDIMRPFEVVEKPIARRKPNGKLEIIQQGTLRNTDTLEAQQEGQQESQQNQSQETLNTPTNDSNTSNAPTNDVNISSTGEVVGVEETNISKNKNVDSINDQTTDDHSIFIESLGKFQQAIRENKDADLDVLAQQLINDLVSTNVDKVLAETAITKAKNTIKRVLEKRSKKENTTMQSSIDEVIINQSSIIEFSDDTNAVKAYKDAVQQMMNQYAKELGIKQINGKYYVNLEDLLRYVNSSTNDSSTASIIYQSLKEYLKTKEAKEKFILMDENQVDNRDFLKNVAKTEEERYLERLGDTTIQRVDITTLAGSLNLQEVNDFYNALDELNQGDILTYAINTNNNNEIFIKDNKGRIVGRLPIPRVDANTGAYIMYNDGWKTDIIVGNNGTINSNLQNLFIHWFTNNSKNTKEISDIIHELAYTKPNNTRKQQLYAILKANPEFASAITRGFTKKDASIEDLATHLTKLLKFINQGIGVSATVRNIQLRKSINNWFKKLSYSYDAVVAMKNNNNFNISVATISDGELIRIVENNKIEAEQQALPADKALAGGVNPTKHKIAVGDKYNVNVVKVSGMENQHITAVGAGNTFVLIPNRSGRPDYAQAFPTDVLDDNLGKDVKEIIKTIHDEINKLLDDHANTPSENTYNALKLFFEKLLSNKNTNSSLFRGLSFTTTNYGFTIGIPGTNNYINIFVNSKNGSPSTLLQIGNDEFEINKKGKRTKNFNYSDAVTRDAFNKLINNLKFNIAYAYIDSDNKTDMQLNGLAYRENGKFVIRVGEKTWTYDSYNEFVLKNNIVRLNTKPSADGKSNHLRKGERTQKANQVFEIKIDKVTSTPVEDNDTTPIEDLENNSSTESIENIPVTEKVKTILDSNSKNKGVDIVKAIIGTDSIFTEDTLKSFEKLGILPKNIKFDAEFNNKEGYADINAETNPSTGEVTVGKRWLDMFNNPNTRSQAIRKLIHEELHNKLYKNKGYVRSAQEIYNEFKAAIENGELAKKGFSEDIIKHLKQYLFEEKSHSLEEFLVESLTSAELATALNAIDANVTKKAGAKNLFQKILELMSKVFGWNVRKGSLYEKELHTLRNVMNDNIEDRTALEESNPIVSRIIKDGEKVQLTPNEKYYINEETNELGVRVTSAIEADDANLDKNGIPKRFDKNSVWVTPSTNIGTGIDEFTRDFFLGKLDKLSEEKLESNYPNVTGSDWVEFRNQLTEFRDKLRKGELIKGKNITIVSRDIKAIGKVDVKMPDGSIKKLNVTGTLDLLGYDQDGKFYIFDMKTVHSDNYISDKEKSDKWNRQLQLYKQCLVDEYGIDVEGTYIIPIKVNYDTPKGATYKDGTDMGGSATYTVRDPEFKTEYDNPMRSQILQNGIEFRDAAPRLEPILKKNPKPGSISYNNLDDAAKAVLDGTITAENYDKQEVETKQEVKEEPIEVKPIEESKPASFGKDNSRKLRNRFRSSITEQSTENNYTSEMNEIKTKAIADGKFMKAPNGNPTNLEERQWLLVRTKNFINWFGDWINDPDNASKVVDKNGEPMVVYHGTNDDFYTFDISHLGINSGDPGDRGVGFYFGNEDVASHYGFRLIPAFLNIRNPYNGSKRYDSRLNRGEIITISSLIENINEKFNGIKDIKKYEEKIENYKHQLENTKNDLTKNIIQTYIDDYTTKLEYSKKGFTPIIVEMYNQIQNDKLSITSKKLIDDYNIDKSSSLLDIKQAMIMEDIKNIDKNIGNFNTADGFISDYELVVFNPNQIKSISNTGEFSTTNDDIRYSSITEQTIVAPSVQSFQERLPLQQQSKFASLVAYGEISTSCR